MPRKRRGRDEGGIHRRTEDGLWIASVSFTGADGKRKRKTKSARTKGEGLKKLAELRARYLTGAPDVSELTLAEYLRQWLLAHASRVEAGTIAPYKSHVENYIIPRLGPLKLAKLSPLHVQNLYAQLAADGVKPPMQRKVGITLTAALNAAVELRVVPYNPASAVKKPRHSPPEMRAMGLQEVRRFLSAASADRLYAFYVLALDSGMRPGELAALRWADVDLDAGHVQVRRSLEEIGGNLRVKDLKTKKSRRRIDLARSTVSELATHRERMRAEGRDDELVFPNTEGGYLRMRDVGTRSFKAVCKRAGITGLRLYDLRHTCATLLLLGGVNPKVVSERLGHSSVMLTLGTYSHVLPTMQRDAANVMDGFLGPGQQTGNSGGKDGPAESPKP